MIPGLVHGFERRAPGTTHEDADEARARVELALEGKGRLLLMRQVHGATVVRAPWREPPEADAALSALPGVLVGIKTADCLPVLIVDPSRRVAAAAHAGWRGTLAGVAARAVEALLGGGSRVEDLVAAIGPGIGPCCYEVGEELREAFGREGGRFFRPGARGRPRLDVRQANESQLRDAGLRPQRIHHLAECTCCRPDLYHSYRRDGPGAGRMISFVGYQA
jgi:hypothetical protein